jgi:hypothetical protein
MSFRQFSPGLRRTLILGAAVVLAAALAGCAVASAPTVVEIDTQATVSMILTEAAPTAAPAVTSAPPTATPPLSFDPVLYQNASAGFEFDHPSLWAVGPDQQQSRGGITAFTSWSRPTDTFPNETPPGETRFDVTVQLWDPTGDLEAFLGQRHSAWDASGIAVLSEDRWTLDDGREAVAFVVEGADGTQSYFFFTTIGDKYLVLSGGGDLGLLAEIAHTVRPIPLEY